MSQLYDTPLKGLEMIEAIRPPNVDEVLLGYEIVVFDDNCYCFSKPRPEKMHASGWLNIGLLTILFWPLMCLPCCLKSSYSTYQRPVYGHKQ